MIEQKRHHAVLIPYYIEGTEMFVYLQKRSEDMKALPGYFGFWGGGIEEGETEEEGLRREIKEELGMEIQNYQFFAHYEFYGSVKEIFIMKVDDNFGEQVVIGEGDFGKFFAEPETVNEPKLLDEDRVVLRNLFGKIKRNNPYGLYL